MAPLSTLQYVESILDEWGGGVRIRDGGGGGRGERGGGRARRDGLRLARHVRRREGGLRALVQRSGTSGQLSLGHARTIRTRAGNVAQVRACGALGSWCRELWHLYQVSGVVCNYT